MAEDVNKTSGRWTLVALALLFAGPLAVAWSLYLSGFWVPGGGANKGELLEPIVTLPRHPQPTPGGGAVEGGYLLGKWNIVHLVEEECDADCSQALLMTRQVRQVLARYIERTQRVVYLSGQADIDTAAHPHLLQVQLDGATGATIKTMLGNAGGSQRIYIVDPLGNLVLAYPLSGPPGDIRDDLKKLLRVSRIG